MESQSVILIITAVAVGFVHTLLGPDHYIPFIAMAKAGKWSREKALWITAASGLGHVLSSVLIGLTGAAAGVALDKLNMLESYRGEFAAWLIVSFGLIYFIWGIKHAYQHKSPHHHGSSDKSEKITPWIIFTIFVFGPCEPLIPLLIYPAVTENTITLLSVIAVFTSVTSLTMTLLVWAGLYGLSLFHFHLFEKYTHAIAGVIIFFCGLSILFLGL